MIAIVTDKPAVGKEIAKVVGATKCENGYMTGNGYLVTWTFGNMLSLAMPGAYGFGRMEREDFPVVPQEYRLIPKHVKSDGGWIPDAGALKQLNVLKRILPECGAIIAATDASREGEMLFRYLYRYLGCTQPVSRLWISSLTDEAIRRGMENLLPMRMFDGMFLAADSRNKADWLLGVNASYAICKATGLGNHSLGRVQTPLLAAICRRYRERENHIVTDSWKLHVSLHKENHLLKLHCTEDFSDKGMATEVYDDCKCIGNARITAVSKEKLEIPAPLLYNLSELQKDASRHWELTIGEVQDIVQTLYEKKLISYPRTSSRHIPQDVFDTLPAILNGVLRWKEFRPYAEGLGIDTENLPQRVVDEDRVTEHPAILITGLYPEGLTEKEQEVYGLILGRMLEAFMPSCLIECTTVDAICAARKFRSKTYRIIQRGWYHVFGRPDAIAPEGFREEELPDLSAGETLPLSAVNLVHKKDLPVNPFTDAELVDYMDDAGLGTATTRANLIRTLIGRKYIRYAGKHIIPTRKGLFVYETVRGMKIANPALTFGWEADLARMERGELTQEEFMEQALALTEEITEEIFRTYKPRE